MEDPERERGLGDFPCDISGHLLGDANHKVVIENQFGRTNHDHLGKLLTHAAMHSAMTGIWLAEKVADDHRKVIDWLNDNTPKTGSLFLAEIKAYRMGDSAPAPQLSIISRPNLQAKIEIEQEPGDLKERHIWRKQMWEEILGYIKDPRQAPTLARLARRSSCALCPQLLVKFPRSPPTAPPRPALHPAPFMPATLSVAKGGASWRRTRRNSESREGLL